MIYVKRRLATIFDPFNDRTSRDIRNTLSTAFIVELTGAEGPSIDTVAKRWLDRAKEPVYGNYIRQCTSRYGQVIRQARRLQCRDPRFLTALLWNAGLFFELHELLESIWQETRGQERTALKGLIQAAGVYVHRRHGNFCAATGLAERARRNLEEGLPCLGFISGTQSLIRGLQDPAAPPPKLDRGDPG